MIIPWAFTRKVPVDVELVSIPAEHYELALTYFAGSLTCQPSKKVAIVRFKRGMQQGLLGRMSRTSLMEYHTFGIVS